VLGLYPGSYPMTRAFSANPEIVVISAKILTVNDLVVGQ